MPSKIEPTTLYVSSRLPIDNNESIALFFKLKKDTEHLYTGVSDASNLVKYNFSDSIIRYLRDRKFLQRLHHSEIYHPNDYQFPKCCWLTDSILTNGLNDPLSVHYNPRLQKNVVHPGQSRSYVSSLFQSGPANFLYFNTTGIKFPWMKPFKIVSQDQLQDLKFSAFTLTPDHGSIIPQIFFGNYQKTMTELIKYHDFITNRLSDMKFRIKSNVLIYPLEYWTTNADSAHIEIFIKDAKVDDDVVRACILSVLGRSYKSDTLEVKINTI
jgi:hypothetical protein